MNIISTETKRPSNDEIAKRAYELYVQRGRKPGHANDDWVQAERELLQAYAQKTATATVAPAAAKIEAPAPVKDRAANVTVGKRSTGSRLKKILG